MSFHVTCPWAGDTACLEFKFSDLEKLQDTFGPGYGMTIAKRLDQNDPVALKTCLEIGGRGGDFEAAMKSTPFVAMAGSVMEALSARLIGRRDDPPR